MAGLLDHAANDGGGCCGPSSPAPGADKKMDLGHGTGLAVAWSRRGKIALSRHNVNVFHYLQGCFISVGLVGFRAMNAVSFSQLGPVIAAILGPMLAFIAASMRFQHLEAVKTRELISDSERGTRRDLADVRERLARIEGRFGLSALPPQDDAKESDEDAAGGE